MKFPAAETIITGVWSVATQSMQPPIGGSFLAHSMSRDVVRHLTPFEADTREPCLANALGRLALELISPTEGFGR